jgi:hypothetical protein
MSGVVVIPEQCADDNQQNKFHVNSERIRPGFVLFESNITIFAEHISEVTERNTLANLISFVGRIGDALYLPEIPELIKNLCFGVTHDCAPLFDSYRIHENGARSITPVTLCEVSHSIRKC